MTPLDAEYDPALVEAAVLIAPRERDVERAFRRERDRLYGLDDPEEREAAFAALAARWFQRLGLDEPLRTASSEQPRIMARCGRCLVVRARGAGDEHADLLVAAPAPPTVLVRVTAATLSARGAALAFLRRELFHVADMLDPAFGYEPGPGAAPPAPLLEQRRWHRYRVLWDTSIDARLLRLGRAAPGARAERWRDFERAFPDLGEGAAAVFERFWSAAPGTHADLLALAGG
jgi:hypothetical protein